MTETTPDPGWYAATAMAAPERDRLTYDVDVDVCVVGGGLAGLTTARELARRGWSVAVLEGKRCAWSASGWNAGVVAPGFAESLDRIVERIGFQRMRALWVLSAGGVDYVRSAIREARMPGVHPVDGYLAVQRVNNPDKVFAQAELIATKLGTEVEAWTTDQVRDVLRSSAYFQGLHLPGGFHIHALNYAIGLAAAAEEAGARIFEETPTLAVDPSGVRKRVDTPSGRVRAGHVVLAGSAHLAPLLPMVSATVLPVTGHVAITAPLGERLGEAVAYAGAVADTRRIGDRYRIVDGDRLMWGGRVGFRLASPRRLASRVRRDIGRIYPQLGEVEIAHAWSGIMGYAVHMMPQIGEISPGLWIASAFGGHGLNTSAMAGELIAAAIAGGDDRWRLFGSYDLVYAGGRFGRSAVQVIAWFARARDGLDEQIAWRRDVTRARQEALAARVAEEARQKAAAEAERLAAEEAERRAEGEVERLATLRAVRHAADEAAYLASQEAQLRVADESAHKAAMLAAEEASRQEEAAAHRMHGAQQAGNDRVANARRAFEEAAQEAERLAAEEAARQAERQALERRMSEETAQRALEDATREAAEQSAHIAAEEAAHRIRQETARLAAEAERLAGDDGAGATVDATGEGDAPTDDTPSSGQRTRRRRNVKAP